MTSELGQKQTKNFIPWMSAYPLTPDIYGLKADVLSIWHLDGMVE